VLAAALETAARALEEHAPKALRLLARVPAAREKGKKGGEREHWERGGGGGGREKPPGGGGGGGEKKDSAFGPGAPGG